MDLVARLNLSLKNGTLKRLETMIESTGKALEEEEKELLKSTERVQDRVK